MDTDAAQAALSSSVELDAIAQAVPQVENLLDQKISTVLVCPPGILHSPPPPSAFGGTPQ